MSTERMPSPWTGVFPAVWTPTNAAGQLLVPELRSNLEFIRRRGVHGFMALGSTGEFPLLDQATRKHALEIIVHEAQGRPVMANVSDVSIRVACDLARHAKACGAAGVSVLPPYFFAVDQVDLAEFCVRVGEAAQLPLLLYNFPERTGNRLNLETIAAVADRVPLAAVKQSGEEFSYHQELARLGHGKKFIVLTGSDTRLWEALPMGARGTVSGLSNVVPELITKIYEAFERGSLESAAQEIERVTAIRELIEPLWFPIHVAALVEARGRHAGAMKWALSPGTQKRYAELVSTLRSLFLQWKLD